jgi:hypothetical protein
MESFEVKASIRLLQMISVDDNAVEKKAYLIKSDF